MRVLLDVSAVPARPVGAGVYAIALAAGLATRRDLDLHLLARRSDPERWERLAPLATVHAEAPDQRPARLAWEQAVGPRLARRLDVDLWHGPHYTMPVRLDVPAVVSICDLTFFDHPEWHERSKVAYFRRMIRASAARARVLVCISEFTATRLRALVPTEAEIFVAHLGVDHAHFTTAADPGADLERLGPFGIRPPYIGFASTIEPRKGVPSLVAAFARVARVRPDLRLVVAGGDGWGATEARHAIEASKVATRVARPGYLPDDVLPAFYRQAVAIAYPSRAEGFGLPALEALACGAPLVTTSGSALDEVVGDAALVVPVDDTDALADALARCCDDDALVARLRAAGPERAAQFTWDTTVQRHVEAYATALGLPAPARA